MVNILCQRWGLCGDGRQGTPNDENTEKQSCRGVTEGVRWSRTSMYQQPLWIQKIKRRERRYSVVRNGNRYIVEEKRSSGRFEVTVSNMYMSVLQGRSCATCMFCDKPFTVENIMKTF